MVRIPGSSVLSVDLDNGWPDFWNCSDCISLDAEVIPGNRTNGITFDELMARDWGKVGI